jgi:hypothetical protein
VSKTEVKERRTHHRHPTHLEVQGTPDEGGAVARMVASNLSLGGLYCTSTTDFPEMTRLAVRLLLPLEDSQASETVDLEAVVVRREELPLSLGSQRFELALFFTSVGGTARSSIERYLSAAAS